jgi:hypothetical protein
MAELSPATRDALLRVGTSTLTGAGEEAKRDFEAWKERRSAAG